MSIARRIAAAEAAEAAQMRAESREHWRASLRGYSDAELLALRKIMDDLDPPPPAQWSALERAASRRYLADMRAGIRQAAELVRAGRLLMGVDGVLDEGSGEPWNGAEYANVARVSDILASWCEREAQPAPADTAALGEWLDHADRTMGDELATIEAGDDTPRPAAPAARQAA